MTQFLRHEEENEQQQRYDPQMAQKIVSVAARLQEDHEASLSAAELQEIGAEVGVDPEFVRQALAQAKSDQDHRLSARVRPRKRLGLKQSNVLTSRGELRAWAVASLVPVMVGTSAFLLNMGKRSTLSELFGFLLLPLLVSWLPGFLTGRKRAGVVLGLWFATCMVLTMDLIYGKPPGLELISRQEMEAWLEYAVPGISIGVIAAWLRARVSPPSWLTNPEVGASAESGDEPED